ncbi:MULTISPECIES: AAA domain-containing protein [unclassified Bacillus (in: firmicutes)]|uniref:AAA domain-containing protein n=1 Tax=unclassified Bacillus (in: firmicutes) TaxID=185979 RepID=UPI0008E50C3E|nr:MULTISPECIES: AAA domain-containing protein [unclassified Bacillus (in: firmicutes)]SFA90877.1 AAA domain-containing protein [Bacillus sp. UNCCL13]SFQ85418.1 AAA domain-containing protein [Bacillus sp. cl95]
MNSTTQLIKEWQKALLNEILHLKKFGSNKYLIQKGRLLSDTDGYTYYFDTSFHLNIPVGSNVRIEWGSVREQGRILSSEGRGVIIVFEKTLGDLIGEAFLFHDPWELLEQLIQRFDDIKKNKQKRLRIKKLMDPSMPAKHPENNIKSNAHELILRSKYNPVTFVWGPPGTGKTYTLARVAANKYFQGKRVLILSHSNQAVDVIIKEISNFVRKKERFKEGEILRYGSNSSFSISEEESLTTSQLLEKHEPDLIHERETLTMERKALKEDLSRSFSKRDSDRLLSLETKISKVFEKIRKRESEFVLDAQIIGTTLAKAASDESIYESEFDLVILDEASMAYVPQAAFSATLAKRVIICGDFKQLPPIASSRDALVNQWLKEDIFHRAGVVDWVNEGRLHPHLFLLKEQRRMHPDISAFTNEHIYGGLVGDHLSVQKSRNEIVSQRPFPNRASILLDTSFSGTYCSTERTSHSRINPWQLLISFQLIHEAYLEGARSIGYVSPYRAQAGLMQKLLEDLYESELLTGDIIAATVHKFQGSERDVMIFDTVDSFPMERAGMLLIGKESERLINVAITRTKGKFIQVSDTEFIKKNVYRNKTLRQLVDHQTALKQNVLPSQIGKWIQNQHARLQWVHSLKLDSVFTDIKNAKKEVIVSFPKNDALQLEWEKKLRERKHGVKLLVISNGKVDSLKADRVFEQTVPFPFIIIDRRLFWLGLPLEGASNVKPPYVSARLDSSAVVEHFLNQLDLD